MSETRLLNSIEGRLPASAYDNSTLVRWFRRLDDVCDELRDPSGLDRLHRAYRLRLWVMEALSHNLRPDWVSLNRIGGSDGFDDLKEERLAYPRGLDPDEYIPIVVVGYPLIGDITLYDGHHRVAAAREQGASCLRAVFVRPWNGKEEWT